jgi:hypothetical protein
MLKRLKHSYFINNIEYCGNTVLWDLRINKYLHRDNDLPAYINHDFDFKEWWQNGKLHRNGDTGLGRIPAHVRELGLTCICPLVTYTSFNAGKKENITEILIYQNCSICN